MAITSSREASGIEADARIHMHESRQKARGTEAIGALVGMIVGAYWGLKLGLDFAVWPLLTEGMKPGAILFFTVSGVTVLGIIAGYAVGHVVGACMMLSAERNVQLMKR